MDSMKALLPITRVFHLFGLSVAVSTSCKFNTYLIRFYFLLLIALRCGIFGYTLWTNQLFLRNPESSINTVIDIFSICSVRLLEIVILIEAILRACEEKKLMENFLEIDDIFLYRLNIDLKCSRLRQSIIKRFTIWVCTFTFVSGCAVLLAYNTPNFLLFLTYMPPYFTASLAYFQIIMWADLIRYRLHILNGLLSELNNNHFSTAIEMKRKKSEEISIRSKGTPSPLPLQFSTIIDVFGNSGCTITDIIYESERFATFCDLYRRLWAQTHRINERFTCSLVLNIGNEFVSFVLNLYYVFVCIFELDTHAKILPSDFLRLPVSIFHIWMLSRTCHKTIQESLKIGYELHSIQNVAENSKLSSNVSKKSFSFTLFRENKVVRFFSDSTFLTSIDPSKSFLQCIWIL